MTWTRSARAPLAVVAVACLASACSGPAPTMTRSDARPSGVACPSGVLRGEGSSAQKAVVDDAINGYLDVCERKARIEYNATGSGTGVRAFTGGLVDWAGSDSPLGQADAERAAKRCGGKHLTLPLVVTPIAFAYNLAGIGDLRLNPPLLAKIFSGQVKHWNDPGIAELNPGVQLPGQDIQVVYRADDSGTSENVGKYLAGAAKDDWPEKPSKKWPAPGGTGKAAAKSAGVADLVKQTPGAITYVEWSVATDNQLGVAALGNADAATTLNVESVRAAISSAPPAAADDLTLPLPLAQAPEGAYPAVQVTYEMVCPHGLTPERAALLKDFLRYFASEEAQVKVQSLGFVPLPEELRGRVMAAVDSIH